MTTALIIILICGVIALVALLVLYRQKPDVANALVDKGEDAIEEGAMAGAAGAKRLAQIIRDKIRRTQKPDKQEDPK